MRILSILCTLWITGCAGIPKEMITETLDSGGKVVTRTSTIIADASVKKEEILHDTLRNRDNKVAIAHAQSGMVLNWQIVTEPVYYPGMSNPVNVTRYLPIITYKEQPRFNQRLPTEPSKHPVWDSVNQALDKGLTGFIVKEAAGVIKEGINVSGDKYNGDYTYSPQTAEPYIIPVPETGTDSN